MFGLLEQRGVTVPLHGLDRLLAACARNDPAAATAIAVSEPDLRVELRDRGGGFVAQFAGNGNAEGVRCLLDMGVEVDAPYEEGDGYFGVPKNSTALQVAAWRARHSTVKLLIARGARVDLPDEHGRTPLALAVRACVDSYWSYRRSAESVEALLRAGASTRGVPFPSGYAEVDALLQCAP